MVPSSSRSTTPASSRACNQLLFKQLRERRGLTQTELAKESGYSLRLIAKAESGQPLALSTLADLAKTLSTEQEQITVNDLISDPLALAVQFIDSWNTDQRLLVPKTRHFLDEQAIFQIHGDPELIPFAGIHRGIEAFDAAIQLFFDVLETPDDHDHRPHYHYLANGTDVMAWGECWAHPIGQPLTHPMPLSFRFRFREGKLYHFEDNYDTQRTERYMNELSST